MKFNFKNNPTYKKGLIIDPNISQIDNKYFEKKLTLYSFISK